MKRAFRSQEALAASDAERTFLTVRVESMRPTG
jgi:hypothetical protein